MMSPKNVTLYFYRENHQHVISKYDSVSFKSVHQHGLEYLPTKYDLIIDVSAC